MADLDFHLLQSDHMQKESPFHQASVISYPSVTSQCFRYFRIQCFYCGLFCLCNVWSCCHSSTTSFCMTVFQKMGQLIPIL